MNTVRGPASIAAVTAAVMIAQQVATSAVRDAFFLTNFPASALPNAMIASSLLSVAFLPVLARMMTRLGPAVVTPWTSALSALLLVAEWSISGTSPRFAAAALFVHTMVFGSALISGFWSLFNERFDPHTAKQLMGRVAGGAALGGVIGGLLVERVGAAGVNLPNLLPMLAAAQLAAAAGSRAMQGTPKSKAKADPARADSTESIASVLRGSSYLRNIALLVAVTAFVSTITSFLLKAQVADTYAESGDLLQFFARYYLVLGLVGFLLQVNLTRFCLNRLGLAMTIATLPAALGGFGLVALATPALWSVALLRGMDEALTNSLFRSGYELLYTPIASGTKRRLKAVVDVGFDRLGKTLGSALLAFALWLVAAGTPSRALLLIVVVGAAISLVLALRLRHGYVTSLTRSLQSQAVSLSPDVLDEAMTLRTIAAGGGIDRQKLLAAISDSPQSLDQSASMDFSGGEAAMWGTQTIFVRQLRKTAAVETPPPAAEAPDDPLVADIIDLRSPDKFRVRRVLKSGRALDRHLVPHVVSLLASDDLSSEAVRVLREGVDGLVGELVDVMLDPRADAIVRRRIPQVLAGCGSQMAMVGLIHALDDPAFELRFRAAGALARARELYTGFVIPRDTIVEAAIRECRRAGSTPVPKDSEDGEDRGLELVFRLLSLVLDPEPMRLAQRAFQSDDAHLRGTALEYLETVLPPNVLHELRPFIGAASQARTQTRTAKELESALLASSAALSIDIAGLRRKLRAGNDSESES